MDSVKTNPHQYEATNHFKPHIEQKCKKRRVHSLLSLSSDIYVPLFDILEHLVLRALDSAELQTNFSGLQFVGSILWDLLASTANYHNKSLI
jgi:hypothetical protein